MSSAMQAQDPVAYLAQARRDSTRTPSARLRRASIQPVPAGEWYPRRRWVTRGLATVRSNSEARKHPGASRFPVCQGPVYPGRSFLVQRRSCVQAADERSSVAVTSRLRLNAWVIHAAPRDEIGSAPDNEGVLPGAALGEVAETAGGAGLPETPSGFESSFFHIRLLDIENWIFEAAYRRAGWNCDSEGDHSTRLTGCKQGIPGNRSGVLPEELHH